MSNQHYELPPRHGNRMRQRLGSTPRALDEEFDDLPCDPPCRRRYRSARSPGVYGRIGVGATLYLVLGGLGALLIVFALNRFLTGVGDFLKFPGLGAIATPTPTVLSSAAVIQRIQALNRLETASYSVQTVIEVQQTQGNPLFDFFAGDSLLLIAHGSVAAGIDLSAIEADDVTLSPDGRTITVKLPPAQIFSSSLDNTRTRVYSRDRGWFAPTNKDLETRARQEAEAQILHAACEDGVLSKATEQASVALQQLLGMISDATIIVSTVPHEPCPEPAT